MRKLSALPIIIVLLLSSCTAIDSTPASNGNNTTESTTTNSMQTTTTSPLDTTTPTTSALSTSGVAPGFVDPDYAFGLILNNVKKFGEFSDATPDTVSSIQDACKAFSSKVMGKVSDSGVEIYLIVGNENISQSDRDEINQVAQQRADSSSKVTIVTAQQKLAAIIIANSDTVCKDICQVCTEVFIGQIH